ncbi:hypothetical protein Ocin01_08766 [Orchesella cincta]|uniref:Uncharacterized protein n=1 Tax=Orchesella cincta TaxID=48709 RepID=A0A1D2MY35_ORCCI|nr:hypothetical protein Ocin01_08766 [Orchesella cincta]
MRDSSSTNETPGVVDGDEVDSLLKLPKAPFGMDLDVHSNRSSVISQDEVQKSPSECSALLGSPDEPDAKKGESRE